jgi:hypothetical protein
MKHTLLTALPLALLLVALPLAAAAHADEGSFLSRFDGSWSGSGKVKRNAESSAWNVTCSVTGKPAPARMSMGGSCSGGVLVSRSIGANLVYNQNTGLYSGIYTGAKVGPAALSGRRSGDRVDLVITWPKPVNGDTKARMTIVNDGRGQLRIQVIDQVSPGGPSATLSDLTFRKS